MSDRLYPDAAVEFEQRILDRERVRAVTRVGSQLLHDAELKTMPDMITDSLLVRLETTVLTELVAEEVAEVDFLRPASWWEALKAEHPRLYRWWRWPLRPLEVRHTIETRTVRWERRATFPHNERVFPRELGPVVYQERVEGADR